MPLRAIRCLDGVAFCALALLLLLVVPGAGRDVLGRLSWLLLLPVAGSVWAAWRLPAEIAPDARYAAYLRRLRLCGLGFLGLAPFVGWWQRTPASFYLMIMACLAIAVGILAVYHLVLVVMGIAQAHGRRDLFLACTVMRRVVLYKSFCGFCSLAITLLISGAMADSNPGGMVSSLAALPLAQVGWWLCVASTTVAAVALPSLATRLLATPLVPLAPPTPAAPVSTPTAEPPCPPS
jgi:hypothetical protein